MKKLIIHWQIKNLESLLYIKEIMDENFKAYGLPYKDTLEYAWLNNDLAILNWKNEVYEILLKLWQ